MGISFGRLSAWNSSHLLEEQSHHQERDVCKDEMEMGVSFPQGKLDQMLLVLSSPLILYIAFWWRKTSYYDSSESSCSLQMLSMASTSSISQVGH